MGSLISLLSSLVIYLLVVIYLIHVVKVKKPASPMDGGEQVFGEAFPEIEMPEPQPEYVAPAREAAPEGRSSKPERKPRGASQPHPQPQPVRPVAAEEAAFDKNEEKPATGERFVRLGNKSEAKKAFIYSEIFKRKY
jgi:hypothetical protein